MTSTNIRPQTDPFVWSGTYAEAVARSELLGQEFSKIDAQLNFRKPIGIVHNDEYREYLEWRRKAVYARQKMMQERASLKKWLKENGPGVSIVESKPSNLRELVAERLDEIGVDYTFDELENLRRRIAAEMKINEVKLLVLDLISAVDGLHDPVCNEPDCSVCDLMYRAVETAK